MEHFTKGLVTALGVALVVGAAIGAGLLAVFQWVLQGGG